MYHSRSRESLKHDQVKLQWQNDTNDTFCIEIVHVVLVKMNNAADCLGWFSCELFQIRNRLNCVRTFKGLRVKKHWLTVVMAWIVVTFYFRGRRVQRRTNWNVTLKICNFIKCWNILTNQFLLRNLEFWFWRETAHSTNKLCKHITRNEYGPAYRLNSLLKRHSNTRQNDKTNQQILTRFG